MMLTTMLTTDTVYRQKLQIPESTKKAPKS